MVYVGFVWISGRSRFIGLIGFVGSGSFEGWWGFGPTTSGVPITNPKVLLLGV